MRVRSTLTPPWIASTWPSSELPAPNAMTGTPCRPQSLTISATSAVVFGKDHGVGRRDVVRRFVLAVLLEYRGAGGDPVAEFSLQRGQQAGGKRFAQWLRGVHGRRWTRINRIYKIDWMFLI